MSNMTESFDLQEWEKHDSRHYVRNGVTVNHRSLNSILVVTFGIFLIIIGVCIGVTFFSIHDNNTRLKLTETGLAQIINLHRFSINFEHEYVKFMQKNISDATFDEMANLLELHNTTKENILQKVDKFEKDNETPTTNTDAKTVFRKQLSTKLDSLFIAFSTEYLLKKTSRAETKQEQVSNKIEELFNSITEFKIETREEEAKILVKLLTQKYLQNLELKMYEMESVKELEEFYEPERQRILDEFQASSNNLQLNSLAHEKLKKELESNLNQVFQGLENVGQNWNLTIFKAKQQVQKIYSEEYQHALLEYKGNELLPPQISLEFHEKISNLVISRCVRQNLIPSSIKVIFESKKYLDNTYHQKVMDNAVIGIDFGDKYAHAAVYFQGKIQTIPHIDRSGEIYDSIACYVGLSRYHGYVGQCAEKILETSLQMAPIIYDMKQIMESTSNTTLTTGTSLRTFDAFVEGNDGKIVTGVGFRYPIQFIVSKLFSKIRDNSEALLGVPVSKCVVTFHYYFSNGNTAISEAAKMAGFSQATLLDAHFAAPMAAQYGSSPWNVTQTILYIDFTCRWWWFYGARGYDKIFNFYKYDNDLKESLSKHCNRKFMEIENITETEMTSDGNGQGRIRKRRLLEMCGDAVISLSVLSSTTVIVPNFFRGKDLLVNVTRSEFETMNAATFGNIEIYINIVLNDTETQFRKEDVDEIVMAGDYSEIPRVKEIMRALFPGKVLISSVRPKEVMAYGAAVKGALLSADAIKANTVN
ncbi:unnamed protein product [Orchesella dallaii]|uniref:Uncharacterized protein n=1 Tax=Orchesella dallaii TaxID=48710 RepID=A0ABP1Q398_9HEXA